MDINYLIQLLGNRLNGLTLAKDQAFSSGDLERINTVDAEILEVKNTLSKLNLILSIEQTAAATSFTEAEVVKNGIEASFNPTIINDATRCLLDYNIAPYATDPNHESNIQAILEKMPPMSGPDQVSMYINGVVSGSPLSGQMFWSSSAKYSVDVRLMVAIVQQDSSFATQGIAVSTFNPGNVGNDGTNTRTYQSWEEGIDAVANWLNNHRINSLPVEIPVVVPVKESEVVPGPEKPTETTPIEETVEPVIPEEENVPAPDPVPVPEPVPVPDPVFEPTLEPELVPTLETAPTLEPAVPTDPVVSSIRKRARKIT